MEDLEDGSIEKDRRAYGGGPRITSIGARFDSMIIDDVVSPTRTISKEDAEKYVTDICKRYPLGEFLRTFQGGRLLEQPEEHEDDS
tara:strand:+ start:407 stop:664 length:258 start_codon:yes stop_codon:yes gene_type:complete